VSHLVERLYIDLCSLRSNPVFIIETFVLVAFTIVISFLTCDHFVHTWTPRVTTWTVIDDVKMDTLETYWNLLVLPYIVTFAYVADTVTSLDGEHHVVEGYDLTERKRQRFLSKFLVMMFLLTIAFTISVLTYYIVLWTMGIPMTKPWQVISAGLMPFAAIALTGAMVLVRSSFTDRRGFPDWGGILIVTAMALMMGTVLAYLWYL